MKNLHTFAYQSEMLVVCRLYDFVDCASGNEAIAHDDLTLFDRCLVVFRLGYMTLTDCDFVVPFQEGNVIIRLDKSISHRYLNPASFAAEYADLIQLPILHLSIIKSRTAIELVFLDLKLHFKTIKFVNRKPNRTQQLFNFSFVRACCAIEVKTASSVC